MTRWYHNLTPDSTVVRAAAVLDHVPPIRWALHSAFYLIFGAYCAAMLPVMLWSTIARVFQPKLPCPQCRAVAALTDIHGDGSRWYRCPDCDDSWREDSR